MSSNLDELVRAALVMEAAGDERGLRLSLPSVSTSLMALDLEMR
jgi:hypothetical protein